MFRISLINMPFANRCAPSLALSQLVSVIEAELGPEAETEVLYLNQEFALFFGREEYDSLTNDLSHLISGLGDWFFRQVAFPDAQDNTDDYLRRFYNGRPQAAWRDLILDKRPAIAEWCADVVKRHDLANAQVVGFTSAGNSDSPIW